MHQASSRGKLLEISLFAVSTILLYNLGLGILLILVPLQIVAVRRGEQSMLLAVAISLVFFFAIDVYNFLFVYGRDAAGAIRAGIDLAQVLSVMIGLVVVHLSSLRRFRTLVRLLAGTLAAGLFTTVLILVAPRLPDFQKSVQGIFSDATSVLQRVLSPVGMSATDPIVEQLLDPTVLTRLFVEYFLRSFLLGYLLLLVFGWWAGTAAASRTLPTGGRSLAPRLSEFRLESFYIWPFIASGALVLLDMAVGIKFFAYVAWNAAFVMLFLFGLQGMAILKFLFEKYRLPRILWALLVALFALLLASPRVNLFFMLAIPAFGVSENWIRYRIKATPETEE